MIYFRLKFVVSFYLPIALILPVLRGRHPVLFDWNAPYPSIHPPTSIQHRYSFSIGELAKQTAEEASLLIRPALIGPDLTRTLVNGAARAITLPYPIDRLMIDRLIVCISPKCLIFN